MTQIQLSDEQVNKASKDQAGAQAIYQDQVLVNQLYRTSDATAEVAAKWGTMSPGARADFLKERDAIIEYTDGQAAKPDASIHALLKDDYKKAKANWQKSK